MFVSNDFSPPEKYEADKFLLRTLTINDVVKDYDAVMSSVAHLRETKPFGPKGTWPTNLTFEQDLIDLGWHQKEFQKKNSFAYTVMTLDGETCLGCVYIYPSDNGHHDAKVILWVRENELKNSLDKHLFEVVKKWLNESWGFKNPGYPGRDISWSEWENK